MGLLNRIFGSHVGEAQSDETRDASARRENAASRNRNVDADDLVRDGLQHYHDGDRPSAERAYRDALDKAPNNAGAHYLLGTLLGESGRLDGALEHLQQATRLEPSAAGARMNMGNVYRAQGRMQDAEAAYCDAIAMDASSHDAHRNLGHLQRHLGRLDDAIASFTKVASLVPEDPDAHFTLADLLLAGGRYQEACRSYRASLALAPEVAPVHNNLGASLRHLSRDQEALACFEEALRIDADFAGAHENLATVLEISGSVDRSIEHYRAAATLDRVSVNSRRCLGRLLLEKGHGDEALQFYREALSLEPDSARSHFELGNALMARGDTDEAIERFRQAVRLDPADANSSVNLGCVLNQRGQLSAAMQAFERALALNDQLVEAHSDLGGIFQQQGRLDLAIQAFERALELDPDQRYVRSNLLSCMNYHTQARPEDVLDAHLGWSKLLANDSAPLQAAPVREPEPERRLRIGYVSADFRFHSVAFFIAPVIAEHDRERFEVTCYANVTSADANTQRIKNMSDNWRDIAPLDDEELAALVARDGIDILVDLSGHTVGNRLPVFARRPAPVQVTYLGYPNTTGLTAVDYRLTDAWSDPPGRTEHLYCEELVRLDQGFLCFEPLATCPDAREPSVTDDAESICFASFNELLKVTPETVAAWSEILERSAGSKLMLKATALADEGTRQLVRERFIAHGLAPERLQLIGRTASLEDHLMLYNSVDVALDTFPYNGTTTTCEALWMGVPVLSLAGTVHASRVGLSILSSVGLGDLVAENRDSFVEKAVSFAADQARRKQLREELRDRMRESPLMDARGFTRRIESAYREMWHRRCRQA